MLSSKVTLLINLVALLAFAALVAMQLLEAQTYTGSFLGLFQ